MTLGRTLQTWAGHAINDDVNFLADFLLPSNDPNTYSSTSVEVERPGTFPLHAYSQPSGKTFQIEIIAVGSTTFPAAWTQMQGWFDPAQGRQYLVAIDEDNNTQRRLCAVEDFEITGTNVARITLRAALPLWEDVTPPAADTHTVPAVVAWSITNDGNTYTPMTFEINPSAAKDDGDSWPTRRRIALANRSEVALSDPVARAYPILLCDLDDLAITPGNDIRVLIGGEIIDHWLEGSLLWINWHMAPRKVATLGATIDADDTLVTVSNADGFERSRWPEGSGFFLIDDEGFQYTDRDTDEATVVRGAMLTTPAAHTAGATLYWVQFPHVSILYGYDAAAAPSAALERKPVLDLLNSTNVLHVLPDLFLNASDLRSRALQQRFSDDAGAGAEHVRMYQDGVSLVFENNQAAADKPNFNDAVLDFPVPLVGPVVMDINVELTMRLSGFVTDSQGYESKLINEDYTPAPLVGSSYTLPGNVSRLRLNGTIGVVVGQFDLDTAASWDPAGVPGTIEAGHGEIEVKQQYEDTFVEFELYEQTKITGLVVAIAKAVGAVGDLGLYLLESSGGKPALDVETFGNVVQTTPRLRAQVTISNADIPVIAVTPDPVVVPLTPLVLEAGAYCLCYYRTAGVGSGLFYSGIGNGGFTTYVDGSLKDSTASMFFGILTDETDPQDNSVLDNGDTIEVANISLPLDSTRTPKIVISAEELIYLLDARWQNDDTGDYLDLFVPLPLSSTLTLDTEAHTAIDSETELDLPWAVKPSNPERWVDLQAGVNDFSWAETGAVGLGVSTVWTPRRL